jgi:protein O-mannosyl-transferase
VVTLPFALLLLDVWPLDRLRLGWRWLAVEKLPLLALSAASSLITLRYQETSLAPLDVVPWSLRAANALASYTVYLGKLFLPWHLAVFYPIPLAIPAWKAAGAALLLAALTALAVWRARREPWLLTGWLWFLGTLVPVIGFVQVGRQAMADRYTYIPSIGLFLAVVWTVAGLLTGRRVVLTAAAGVVILALAAVTRTQIGYWADSATLFRHALAATDDGNYLAHIGLGKALLGVKDCAGAAAQFQAVLARYPYMSEARAGLEAARKEGSCSTRSSTPR